MILEKNNYLFFPSLINAKNRKILINIIMDLYLNHFFNLVSTILDFFPEVFCFDYSDNNYIITIKKE